MVFVDTVSYIISKPDTIDNVAGIIGFMLGIVARACVLYGLATCWLLV